MLRVWMVMPVMMRLGRWGLLPMLLRLLLLTFLLLGVPVRVVRVVLLLMVLLVLLMMRLMVLMMVVLTRRRVVRRRRMVLMRTSVRLLHWHPVLVLTVPLHRGCLVRVIALEGVL